VAQHSTAAAATAAAATSTATEENVQVYQGLENFQKKQLKQKVIHSNTFILYEF